MKRIDVRLFPAVLLSILVWTEWGSTAQIEARGGFFIPASNDVRNVYKNGFVFGADLTVPVLKGLCAWGGLDYFSRNGELTYTQETTTLRIIPVFAGLKLQSASPSLRPYAAVAAGYFFYREANVIGTVAGQKIGLVAQVGLLVLVKGRISLDIHGRYTACRAGSGGPDSLTTELGGFQGGLGLAVRI